MLKALNPLTPEWYTPKTEEGKDNPTRFKIRPLSGVEAMDLELFRDVDGNTRITGRSARTILRHGLIDWENFGTDAEKVVFKTGNPDENIARLPNEIADELVAEVFRRTVLMEADRKN
jgi:hypothetical protein